MSYCVHGHFGLERDDRDVSSPYDGIKIPFLHFFTDASPSEHSITGGVGMLACGCIMPCSQRQHLAAPCATSSEIVAAGTVYSLLAPVAGVCQNLRIRLGMRVPLYIDNSSTVFISKSDTAVKKSAWLIRRAAVLSDAVEHNELEPVKISEVDMAADPFTKYLPYGVWVRHLHYYMNLPGELPARPQKSKN